MKTDVTMYEQDEVQELFDVVFKISAKEIDEKLKKVINRPDIAKRRWFWELLQNAKDSINSSQKVSVKLIIDTSNESPFIEFQHNGNPFRYQDAKNLIFPYSDKENEKNDNSGKFGTGFLATHILSNTIFVRGVYIKDPHAYDFHFTLDRSGIDKSAIADSINYTWQEFRINRNEIENYTQNTNAFETRFRYFLNDESKIEIINHSIEEIEKNLPLTLSFISKIESVTIENINSKTITSFKVGKSYPKSESIIEYEVEKIVKDSKGVDSSSFNIIVVSNDSLQIALEIDNKNDTTHIRPFYEHQPMLFCGFPLIGANDFKFPLVINSSSFLPKEERDGIWLDNTAYGIPNQKLFEGVIKLYDNLLMFASRQNWEKTYLLFKSLNEETNVQDINKKWFKDNVIDKLKSHAVSIPLVDTFGKGRLPASECFFSATNTEENRVKLWGFLKNAHKNLTKEEEINEWYSVLIENCGSINVGSFTKELAALQNIEALSIFINSTMDDTIIWLNEYISFVNKVNTNILNDLNGAIFPNQFGVFKKKDDIYFDDGTIDEPLKEILAGFSKFNRKADDWRTDLLDKRINFELPTKRIRNVGLIAGLLTEVTKDLLKLDNPSDELRNVFSNLLNWLYDHPKDSKEHFKDIKTEALLYRCTGESKIRKFTELFQMDRDGRIGVEDQIEILNDPRIHLLKDPDLEKKVKLGELLLADQQKQQIEFDFKKQKGDIFENAFKKLIKKLDYLTISKEKEEEEDFIIRNIQSGNDYYIELKSIDIAESSIQMTHKQAKKANEYPDKYYLCVIPNNGQIIDEDYILANSKFDSEIGQKLRSKVRAALAFETPENGINVEFEDQFLKQYKKYRYKFNIQDVIWGQDGFEEFIHKLL